MRKILSGFKKLKRVRYEIALLIFTGFVLFILPVDIKHQGLELFLYKVILFSASQIHALLVRKVFFNYIDFRTEQRLTKNIMVIAIHVMSAYVYAQGG